jgi:hypothetical protein
MRRYDDEDEAEDDEWDDEQSAFDDDDDDEPTVPCPYCRRDILEDTPRCPYCERYISAEDGGGTTRPTWIVVTALLCLAIAIWCVFTLR